MLKRFVKENRAVVSLEASIVLPMFIMLLLFFYGIIIMFLGQQMMSHALTQSAQSLSLDPYSNSQINGGQIEDTGDLVSVLYGKLFEGQEGFYAQDEWYNGENETRLQEVIRDRYVAYLVGGSGEAQRKQADEMLDYVGVVGGLDGVDLSASKIEGDVLTIKVKYKQEFLFDFNGLASFDREMEISTKLWRKKG